MKKGYIFIEDRILQDGTNEGHMEEVEILKEHSKSSWWIIRKKDGKIYERALVYKKQIV